MSGRPRRRAAVAATIIIESSECEEDEPKPRRRKVADKLDDSFTLEVPRVVNKTTRKTRKRAIKEESPDDSANEDPPISKRKRVKPEGSTGQAKKPRSRALKKENASSATGPSHQINLDIKEEEHDAEEKEMFEEKEEQRTTSLSEIKKPRRVIKKEPNKGNIKKEPVKVDNIKEELLHEHAVKKQRSKQVNIKTQQAKCSANINLLSWKDTTLNSSVYAKIWSIHELLADTEQLDLTSSHNIVELFENDNTIPFICRYRRDLIGHGITPEKLRAIKNSYNEIVALRKKAESIVQQLEKEAGFTEQVRDQMLCARTPEELEFLYAPYKPANKGSLADRAKALGLEVYADHILLGTAPVYLEQLVNHDNPDLDSIEKVESGICNIISHNIAKHTGVLEELRRLQKLHSIMLISTKAKITTTKKEKDNENQKHPKADAAHNNHNDELKFEQYFNFRNNIHYVKPHQTLAINRGEKSKFLSVKVILPDYFKLDIKRYIKELFLSEGIPSPLRTAIFEKAFEECYTKKLVSLVTRQIRSGLNDAAKRASIQVFAKNLKQLLLMPPLKGQRILGIDPGFTNGCKVALISETADVLETTVLYPHKKSEAEFAGCKLANMLAKNNCKVIALGNGTACRETEFWLTKLFANGILDPQSVSYSIVSEQGASIYSCSEVAKKEFPKMDMNLISAVSIARRLNDPLSEYVKIEPRHIGVGMYQHDINEKVLSESLIEVVSECVSYVGVDINTASLSVLRHIAGLTEKRAEKIIEHRQENGPFRTRKDLLQVKTIGEKTFTQCAGFIRIEPKSLGGEVANLLDCTWVHPESYDVAKKIISRCGLNLKQIGQPEFISRIRQFARAQPLEDLVSDFKLPTERIQVVLEGLQRELFKDYRADSDKKPLFKQGITRITDLFIGEVVTGCVTNVTHFGAFVDIGVECDGLIHVSKMNGFNLNIGDRVNASVLNVDVERKRIQLRVDDLM